MSSIISQIRKETQSDLRQDELTSIQPTEGFLQRPKLTGMKVAIFFAHILAVAAIAGVGYVYYNQMIESRQLDRLESSHIALSAKSSSLETAVDEQSVEIAALNSRLTDSVNEGTAVRSQLEDEIEKRRIEIVNFQKKLKVIENSLSGGGTFGLEEGVSAQPTSFSIGKNSDGQVLAGSAGSLGAPLPATAGIFRVLTVNQKFNFVVTNLGVEQGVQIGDLLQVTRSGDSVAVVEVEKLYDNFSAATVVEAKPNFEIEVGDLIRRK